ncbi:MAG: hypothetical protein JRH20_01755 [Deltaproteobacteria bacterium]|nr:hypothetical protein [Deltaproteobacteria bacterium]
MRSARLLITPTLGAALFFSLVSEVRAERVGVVTNDGRGGGYRRGGTYKAVKYDKFSAKDTVGYQVLSGTFKYWTIHARYNGGFWKTVYKGPQNNLSMKLIRHRVNKLGRGRPTHLNFSVNGAHERYEPIACRLAIRRLPRQAPPPAQSPGQIAVVTNDGRGGGYRRGGTYAAVKYNKFGVNDRVGYRVLSGTFKYWTIHARYKGGFWKTVYKGPKNLVPMAQIRQRVAKLGQGRPTHLNFSVNGAHERYERIACRLAIIQRLGSAPPRPPVARGDTIQVVAGTYGKNCGTHRGNKTAHLRQACQGRRSCVYTIDHRVIGDPRRGCGKNYIAEWRCGSKRQVRRAVVAPEAGFRKQVTLSCGAQGGHVTGQGTGHGHGTGYAGHGVIRVVSGTYGQNCGARHGNKTRHLRKACQGQRSCSYTIDYRVIGDPRRGCGKNYVAEWRCSGTTNLRRAVVAPEAGFRKRVVLTCGRGFGRPHVPPPPVARPAQAFRLFRAVAKQSSSNFKHNRYRRLRVATNQFDRVPYHMASAATRTLTVQPGQRCFLAGNKAGTAGFGVDNFLYIKIGRRGKGARFVVGAADPVTHRGRPVARLGGNKFKFRAGEIDLTSHIPKGVPTRIKVLALDYGAVGYVSDVFLIVR